MQHQHEQNVYVQCTKCSKNKYAKRPYWMCDSNINIYFCKLTKHTQKLRNTPAVESNLSVRILFNPDLGCCKRPDRGRRQQKQSGANLQTVSSFLTQLQWVKPALGPQCYRARVCLSLNGLARCRGSIHVAWRKWKKCECSHLCIDLRRIQHFSQGCPTTGLGTSTEPQLVYHVLNGDA